MNTYKAPPTQLSIENVAKGKAPVLQREVLIRVNLYISVVTFAVLCLFGIYHLYDPLIWVAGIGGLLSGINLWVNYIGYVERSYIISASYYALLFAISPFLFGFLQAIPFAVLILMFITSYVLGNSASFWRFSIFILFTGLVHYVVSIYQNFEEGPHAITINSIIFIFSVVFFFFTLFIYFREFDNYKRALTSSQQFLDKITDLNPNPLFVRDEAGNMIRVNQAFVETFQLSAEQVLHQTIETISIDPNFTQDVLALDQEIRMTQEVGRSALQLIQIGAEKRWLEISIAPIKNAKGELEATLGIVNDLSERMTVEEQQRAEMASEQRFRKLFEHAPMAILMRNPDELHYSDANSKAAQLFGFTKAELVQMSREELLDYEEEQPMQKGIQGLREQAISSFQVTKKYRRKDGSTFWAKVDRCLVQIADKDYLIGFIENIDEKRKTEQALLQSEMRLRNIMTNAYSLFVVINQKGELQYISPNTERILKIDQTTLQGRSYETYCHPDDFSRAKHFFCHEYYPSKGKSSAALEIRLQNGKQQWQWFELKLVPLLLDNTPTAKAQILIIARNIHEEKLAKLAIQRKVTELNIQKQELEKYIESNMQLENYAYIASHDLRAPVRTIVSFAQLLRRSAGEKLTPKELDFLEFITSATSNMNELIDDLLTFSRANTEKLSLQQVALPTLLEEVLSALNVSISQSEAAITVHEMPPTIVADRIKLSQLFQNLLSNAIKFRKVDTPPIIDIFAGEEDTFWTFAVRDNGIGIQAEFQQKIFLLFRKLHPLDQYEGTGIGLALCKKIVDQHQGRIWVESTPDHGATFYFSLPKQV
ncbi:MAG: PAS domain S-box protein [Bacteroidota bacterium]